MILLAGRLVLFVWCDNIIIKSNMIIAGGKVENEEKAKNPIQVAERIFQAVEELSLCEPAGLVELSNRLELHKSTVHRILSSLQMMGYVRQEEDTGKYRLSLKWMEISNRITEKLDIVSIARPYLRKLSEISGETVHLVEVEGNEAIYIDKVESGSNSIRMVSRVGSRIPLYCSGVGKAMLAERSDEEIEEIWNSSDIRAMTPKTILSLYEFLETIREIRKFGYALDNEENEMGVRCIAASILDHEGKARNAFSISAPVGRMTDEKLKMLAEYVLESKRNISGEFGFR